MDDPSLPPLLQRLVPPERARRDEDDREAGESHEAVADEYGVAGARLSAAPASGYAKISK